jgi:hypothetical protein
LKAAVKHGLLTLEALQKQRPDVLVTSVNAFHPSHESYVATRKLELKVAREEKKRKQGSPSEGTLQTSSIVCGSL